VGPQVAHAGTDQYFVAAEELGYDSGWVIHRHFRQGNEHASAPLVLPAVIAERTTRIRPGTAVLVLPLADPPAAAEDAAVLDTRSSKGMRSTPRARCCVPRGPACGEFGGCAIREHLLDPLTSGVGLMRVSFVRCR
jgi:Luciferase-like monooxygenase